MIGFNGFCLLVFIVLVGVITYVQYTKEDTVTATVQSITTQQSVSGTDGNVSTPYTYLVGTDKGTMQIQPDGIMSSTAFGRLKEAGLTACTLAASHSRCSVCTRISLTQRRTELWHN